MYLSKLTKERRINNVLFLKQIANNQLEDLYKQLTLYKLRSKVEINNLSNEFVVTALSREQFIEFKEENCSAGKTIKFREDPVILDPRCIYLGARLVINLE